MGAGSGCFIAEGLEFKLAIPPGHVPGLTADLFQVDFGVPSGFNTAPSAASLRPNQPYDGQVAQLVEQRIENPRVGGSIPPLATTFFDM